MYIKLENINKEVLVDNYNKKILDNINLEINKGDFICIIGSNGAGKSTLLNAIAGNLELSSGKIFIDGKDISKNLDFERAKYISRVFQNPLDGTAPRMSVEENMSIAFKRGENRGLKYAKSEEKKEIYKKLLKTLSLGLEDRLESEIGILSGGQRQAISLLMATMNNPKLILLDEHSAALDPKTQKKIMEITNDKIINNNLTALMITHNIEDAINYGNRIIVMHEGKIVREIFEKEKQKMTKKDVLDILSSIY